MAHRQARHAGSTKMSLEVRVTAHAPGSAGSNPHALWVAASPDIRKRSLGQPIGVSARASSVHLTVVLR
jgi:hypothetical protein